MLIDLGCFFLRINIFNFNDHCSELDPTWQAHFVAKLEVQWGRLGITRSKSVQEEVQTFQLSSAFCHL